MLSCSLLLGLKAELGEATEKGDIDKVKQILEKVTITTDVKIKREGMGKSPLLLACTYGQTPIVEELLQVSMVRYKSMAVSSMG